MAQECKTSPLVTKTRTGVCVGKETRLSVSNNRKSPNPNSLLGTIYESNLKDLESLELPRKSGYSYLQYHWCPVALRLIPLSLLYSSKVYNSTKEGKAIWTKINAGIKVQIHSKT